MPRVLLVGWDGADWRILDPLLERGDLPNLQALISRGQRAVLRSTVPTHSWAAWPSFLTGVDPADHGVYDIVPLMFPAPDVGAGKILAGGVLPKGRVYSHPANLPDTLEKAGKPWVINGMSWTTYRHRPEPYLAEALDITGKRIRATEWLMDNTDWDLCASVWVSVDRTQHALSNYVGPDHPDYAKNKETALATKVRGVYKQLDDALGSFVSRTDKDDLVIFMSDH